MSRSMGMGARVTPLFGERDDDVDLARDRELVERAQGGDRSAFDDLYRRYHQRLLRFCLRRLHDPHDAEDVVQEAFARAWKALPTFAGERRFYPWLSVIAGHLCTDVSRRSSRTTPVAEIEREVAAPDATGEDLAVAAVDSELVTEAFARLSERHQRILRLREGRGMTYQGIADHEGLAISAVETVVWRARQALKREYAAVSGEGRFGAALGALAVFGALGRWLRRQALRVGHLAASAPTAAVAGMGAAAVATAAVVAVGTVGTPAATTGQPNAALAASAGSGAAGARTAGSGSGGGSGRARDGSAAGASLPAGGAGGARGSSSGSSGAPGASSGKGSGAGTSAGSTGGSAGDAPAGSLGGTLGGVTAQAGDTLNQVAGSVPLVGGTLQQVTAPLTDTLDQVPSQLAQATSGLLGSGGSSSTGSTSTGSSSTGSSGLGTTVSTVACAASGVTGAVGGVLGGLTGATTTTTAPCS